MENQNKDHTGMKEIFTRFITRNGKRIYHPTGVFHFWVKDDEHHIKPEE